MAFAPSTHGEQSILYGLEDVLHNAITQVFGSESLNVLAAYQGLIGRSERSLDENLGSRVSYFLGLTPAKRRSSLAAILHSMTPVGSMNMLNPSVFERYSWDTLGAMKPSELKL